MIKYYQNPMGIKISISGSTTSVQKSTELLNSIELCGNEEIDRIRIQTKMDLVFPCAYICYQGNTVYSLSKIVNEFKKLKRSGSIEKMTDRFYKFLTCACGEIAHYNKESFISYFNDDWSRIEKEILAPACSQIPSWQTDVKNIFNNFS